MFNIVRIPYDGLIVCNKFIPYLCHCDEPCASCIVKKGCVTSPAERIAVLEGNSCKKKSFLLKILNDGFIAVLYEFSSPGLNL